ncbi:1,4-alpha-glucan branching enzyme GlgB [Corynascus novoguineensis]|uniref:1,4-alpha-glucan branching enzyme GlgB n=1 Tax=Corynascus novoguineensis TaxID=1126955 RepID=A0AAN7CYX1_9PEZI|nr:1,4-alpha-glucan branching enzyme GlgB [Corynascus novoguineensis]
MYPVDILNQRHEKFVLWVPSSDGSTALPPVFVGLWVLHPTSVSPPLADGVYRYWYEIQDTSPAKRGRLLVTDPLAFAVDYDVVHSAGDNARDHPASVVKIRDGKLWACDIDGTEPRRPLVADQTLVAENNHLVIYELPTSWTKAGTDSRGSDVDVGTFSDVLALFDTSTEGRPILAELGINALELLPPADAKVKNEWGYATAHYFTPDYDLGSLHDLGRLVDKIHSKGIRFFADVVMAFGHNPYSYIDFDNFHLQPSLETDNPDSCQSERSGQLRDGFGGYSWRYIRSLQSYDPDVNNIGNYNFLQSYRKRAWELYKGRSDSAPDASKFLVIGEELSTPILMVHRGVVDALWNEPWQGRLRASILGESTGGDSFEWTVRKLVDCRLDDINGAHFTSGVQAVNYITSHDIEGYHKGRLYNFLVDNGISNMEKRVKLAFALLLTSVGIPMIFAGEEFADQMDRSVDMGKKQSDPVNYRRKNDGGWRQALFGYVAHLVRCRTKCPALGENDTEFLHVDASRGGKIMAWRRGLSGDGKLLVVVVANFSDENTPGPEHVIPNWPDRDQGS